MISWRMAAAWVVALVVATVLTWQIVGLADSQVGEAPVALAPNLTTPLDHPGSTTTTAADTSSTAALAPTTTTIPGATTSSSTSSSPSTSSVTASSTSSASSTATAAWSLRTVTTPGGVVVVRYRPGEVELQAATPAPGFAVEVDDPGPPRVRVEFEAADTDVRVEVRWDNGALDVDVDVN